MSERDLEILEILWKADGPMIAMDIVNEQVDLTQSTVTTALRKMLAKKLVEVVGIVHSGRVLSRQYRATQKAKECVREHLMQEYFRVSHMITPEELYEAIRGDEQCQQ